MLDAPDTDLCLARRSLRDIGLANALLGGARAVLAELSPLWSSLPHQATLLDVGTGRGDIPAYAARAAARHGVVLATIGVEASAALAAASRDHCPLAVCADARHLPFRDHSVDVVTCSQVLHHFFDGEVGSVLAELDRVARDRVVVSDLRRSRVAALGIWVVSFILGFHPVSRHDGVVSVMRGFRAHELGELVAETLGRVPRVRHRLGYRITASWVPEAH